MIPKATTPVSATAPDVLAEPGSVAVVVSDGRVTLNGTVETEADREMLALFGSRVPGSSR
jgi:osmotically-inducible protein OsmY